jgi:radical SAM peptide maturase (CXXX-repeat target family)
MKTHLLEKDITLYKVQFDKFVLEKYKDYRLDRLSLEIDALLFRMKYMVKHNYDLDKIPDLRKEFTESSMQLRSMFSNIAIDILQSVSKNNDMPIKDMLIQNVEIDTMYCKYKMLLLSDDVEFLQTVDNLIPDNDVLDIFPDQYFRFTTDSYNNAIAKAYPELFSNKRQDQVGCGDDADVFCHNFTFQVTERCSLNCFAMGTKILMADWTEKNIEDISCGDEILGIDESDAKKYHDFKYFKPYIVTNMWRMYEPLNIVKDKSSGRELFRVTDDHPFLTSNGEFKPFKQIIDDNDLFVFLIDKRIQIVPSNSVMIEKLEACDSGTVCNLTTTCHTYIANNAVVHNCTYCYQFNKTNDRMSFDTAKKFVDNLLADKYGYINRYNSPAIIIEFIGGEPLLEIELIKQIYEYFLDQCYKLNHPWFALHRLSICSNGMQYFDDEVQEFFKEYAHNISFNISIDGNKQLHDSCRIQPNGEGSYDIDIAALNHYNKNYTSERNSKMTLAPSNIMYLYDSVVDFIKNDMKCINMNCVFEEGWTRDTAATEYYQLKKLARYLISNNLEHIYISIFNEKQEDKEAKHNDSNFCGGTGSMLALRPNGQFYPCIRYMPTSVGNDVKDLCIGNIDDGLVGREQDSEVLKLLDSITRRSQTNDICFDCPIGNDCASCSALGHTVFGTPNKKATFTCIQMIAEALANVYYWNNLYLKYESFNLIPRINNVPDDWALLVIDDNELYELKLLECAALAKYVDNQ